MEHFQQGSDNNHFKTAYSTALLRRRMGEQLIRGVRYELNVDSGCQDMPTRMFLYCPQHALIYAPIPKVACSSLKTWIYDCMREDMPLLPDLSGLAKREFHLFLYWTFCLGRYYNWESRNILSNPKITKFTFVRNPFDRIASAYLDKFVRKRGNENQWEHTRPVLQKLFGRQDVDVSSHSMSFRQFVQYLVEAQDNELDLHWQPMKFFIEPFKMDFVGRIENIAEDFARLKEITGMQGSLKHINKSHGQRAGTTDGVFTDHTPDELLSLDALPEARQLYDEQTEKGIAVRYARDFELFEYSKKIVR